MARGAPARSERRRAPWQRRPATGEEEALGMASRSGEMRRRSPEGAAGAVGWGRAKIKER